MPANPDPTSVSRPGDRPAFYVLASISVAMLAAAAAPTPLYALYRAQWGFSPIVVTVVFGIYALAVLTSLLTVGSLSDHLGRRPVLAGALVVQVGAMAVFTGADGVGALLAARVVQGLATGAAVAAVGAGLLDLDAERGAIANAVSPMLGTGLGALASGLVAQWLPAPTLLVYALYALLFAAQAVALAALPETSPRRPGAIASLAPRLALPLATRRPMLVAAPAIVAAWALAGFYGSIGSAVVKRLLGSDALALGGLGLSVLAAGAAGFIFLTRRRSPREVLSLGAALLVAGVGVTLGAIALGAAPLFFAGALVAGAGVGGSFQGAVRSVLSEAPPAERAGVLALLFVVAYLAMGIPAVLGGLRLASGVGIGETALEYGLGVMGLGAIALANARRGAPRHAAAPAPTTP